MSPEIEEEEAVCSAYLLIKNPCAIAADQVQLLPSVYLTVAELRDRSHFKEEVQRYIAWHCERFGQSPQEAAEVLAARFQERRMRRGNDVFSLSPSRPASYSIERRGVAVLTLMELIGFWNRNQAWAVWKVNVEILKQETQKATEPSEFVSYDAGDTVLVLCEGRWQEATVVSEELHKVRLRLRGGFITTVARIMIASKFRAGAVDSIATKRDYESRKLAVPLFQLSAERMRRVVQQRNMDYLARCFFTRCVGNKQTMSENDALGLKERAVLMPLKYAYDKLSAATDSLRGAEILAMREVSNSNRGYKEYKVMCSVNGHKGTSVP